MGVHGGDRVEVMIEDGDIVIRRAEPRFVLAELFAGKSPEEWRAAYADAYAWGVDGWMGNDTPTLCFRRRLISFPASKRYGSLGQNWQLSLLSESGGTLGVRRRA